ncbi:MAG TPA: nitrous oxide reductase family maturation protein NosD, partial [Candidatus Binatia bacterium]|nr:nitrous oxide reductase family maturation protein NosD [Candidatus Binatia bacterium]
TTSVVRKDAYWEAYGPGSSGDRTLLGYVFLTDDLVKVPGYSGHTINTLVGMDVAGKITGVKIIRHSEPIVLIGLSEKVMHDFVGQYLGKDIRSRVVISDEPREGYVVVDAIASATVTAVAENATILEAAREVGRRVGIISAADVRTRRPSDAFEPLRWDELIGLGGIGEMTVARSEVGAEGPEPALELYFGLIDAPSVGRNLLGDRYYPSVRERMSEQGVSAIFVGSVGEVSFKGAGFARGGIFDRFAIEQNGRLHVFKDVDYISFPDVAAAEAPALDEGGIFLFANPEFDPAAPFTIQLTLPYRVGDTRTYGSFGRNYELPRRFVVEERPFWVERWRSARADVVGFVLFLTAVTAAFARRWQLVRWRKWLHYSVAAIAAGWVGLVLKAQPTTTQILTLGNAGARGEFPIEIFLSEPLIFIFWIVIAVTLVIWGRGYFCGWLCPYGAFLELLCGLWHRLAPQRLRVRIEALPDPHFLRYIKYATFGGIFVVGLVNLPLAEAFAEIEPFKTFILHLVRPWMFVAYFTLVTVVSVVHYRAFCRFVCPLGGAMAVAGRRPLRPLTRYEQCSSCKICFRGCEPKAIEYATGRIDYAECLQCWDCQATARDDAVCPELILSKKERRAPRIVGIVLLLGAVEGGATAFAAVTHRAEPNGPTIAAAIATAAPGDTVTVAPGHYREHLVIDKPLALIGEQGAVIDAGGEGRVVFVTAADVTVEGLTLRGCGRDPEESNAAVRTAKEAARVRVVGNVIEDCPFGVWIHGSADARIEANRIRGIAELGRNDRGNCVHLADTRGAKILRNDLSTCRDGIYMELGGDTVAIGNKIVDSRYSVHTMWCDNSVYEDNVVSGNLVGLALMFSKGVTAKRNIVHDNATHGILLTQVTRSVVADNVVIGNTKGLFVYNSLYNDIRDNFVARNGLGLHYWGGSEENQLRSNAFVENEIQVKFVAAYDQDWAGNFWSDYVGWDVDGNGVGDVPYRSNTLVDDLLARYPLAKLLLASPALQMLSVAERQFPVITVPKGVDPVPRMAPAREDWVSLLERYPATDQAYYGSLEKLPHLPGES